MLRIKQAQLDHFANRQRGRFVKLMVDYLRAEMPAMVRSMDDAALERWMRGALAKCEKYGVDTEPEAAQLTLLLLLLGLDADDRSAWVREALAVDKRPIGKVRRLVDGCRAHGIEGLDDVLVFESMAEKESVEA
ncbi:MAG TPA: hypothetical protein VL400_03405 [Polyangiaceae bacterium]|jgi:hypothetical protein|nr:hypothetical protein [Polyangiaceae bacterium]